MTSTNDGKDVKSNQTSGHKSKSYYIELYTSLEKALSGDGSLEERTAHVCEAWRRVYSLYQHSATSTHPHLLSWLQRHTANTVLQSKWAKSKNEQARLTNAIDALVAEATSAAAGREQHPWEKLLLQRAAWFRKAVENPWDNPVLKSLINPNSEPVTDQQVLEWLVSEHGVVLVTRLQRMVGAGNCDDLALLLASAVMDRARAAIPHRGDDLADERVEEENPSSFVSVLEREASFTADEWEMLTDMELVLLLKTDKRPRCIDLAKLTPLRHGYKMVERLRKRLEMSPRDKKLWKHAKDVATLVAQVVIARCMVLGACAGAARDALYWCARALARLVRAGGGGALRDVSAKLAAPAATARHLHTFCAALSAECKELQTDVIMKPVICELYIRAITAGMNELAKLKLAEKESEARSYEQTLAGWFTQLGGRLADSARLRAECALTAFSVHPARKHFERVAATPPPPRRTQAQELTLETTSEYGSWANDSRTQSNLVKTSETLQLKQSQQHQANVLSTAILTEGEALGLETELCQDLAVLLSGPRVKTLSWDMDREVLLENCRAYMERTHGGTRAVTTELKYLNLDPDAYRHLPEEGDDESDLFYGIEKGYEHEVQLEAPEDIWQNAFFDPEQTESANDSEVDGQFKKKSKARTSEEDEDPLSNIAEAKREKKKLAKEKSKERRKKSHKQDDSNGGSRERRKDKDKKTKKEGKKDKSEPPTTGSLTSLLGMKVSKMSAQVLDGEKRVRKKKERRREPPTMFSYVSVTDSDYDSQGKSSHVSEHDPNVLVDGVFSMDELGSPDRTIDSQKPIDNTNIIKNNAAVQSPVIKIKTRPVNSPLVSAASSDSDVSRAKSPYLTPNQLGPRHVVNSKVKSSIAKLLQFRRNKSLVRDVPRPPPSHTPTKPTNTLVGMKIYNVDEIPKGSTCLNKKQSKQLETLSKEVDDLFNETSTVNYRATPETDIKPQQHLYNEQKYQQQYNNAQYMSQSMYSDSQKREYTQHSIRPAQQTASSKSPYSGIHTNYASPIKTPEHMRTHALNLTPPKPTMTYQPYHKSMQNLPTDANYEPPKKPQLINDLNYFNQQHVKSNTSQLSPKIISNTCIKPPIQTPSNIQQYSASVNDNTTKSSQMYSNLHGTYTPRGPAQANSQKQLSSSMQNISEVPGRYDATKIHVPKPNMHHDQASKLYSVISQSKASNTSQALCNSNNTTASRCVPIQHRQRVDKTHHKPNLQDNIDEYLQELVKYGYASANNGQEKSRTIALNKEVIITTVPPSTAAKRVDPVTPQCAKQLIQQKKTEKAPNTFSRRNYMHKNKQSEKINLTDTIALELNRTIDHKISMAKSMKNEVTISRVGPNAQDLGNVIRKVEQPCTRLQRDCPVLSSMLDSSAFTNAAISNTTRNQANREDADLLLLLRNQTLTKPNVNPIQTLPSDLTLGQTSNNQQIKVETQVSSAHQALVGTKVKNINILDNTSPIKRESEENKSLEWRSVMDAIIAQKTEPLGPNALDLALKKNYKRQSQSSSRAHSSDKLRVSEQSSSHTKPFDPKKREHQSSKASSSRKPSTDRHPEVPKKPRELEIIKNTSSEMLNRTEVPNKTFKPTIPKVAPQTPVIPNSDYDTLDDLIDDDLRRELGEISSDEDAYSPPNAALLKGKTQSNIPKTATNVCKAANISKEKTHIVNPKTLPTNETNLNVVDCNRRFAVNTCPTAGYPNVITNNSSHPTYIDSQPAAVISEALLRTATSTIISNQVALDTANNIVTSRIEADQFMSNVLPANVIIASVSQPPVVVIRQDLVYDPYPTIRIHESQVNAELCSINQNMYALNATPNIAVYQTTQYAAPVINPIIIGNAMTNVSNATAMGNDHDTPDCTKDVIKQDQDNISLEEAIRLTDDRNQTTDISTKIPEAAIGQSNDRSQTPELPTNLDFNMNRNFERKVLSQVQEKHPNDNVDKDSPLKRSPVDDSPFKIEENRIKLKRQSLLNRKISHAGYHPPIPLTYTPLTVKVILEKHLQHETPKNGIVRPNLKPIPNSTSVTDKCVVISSNVQSPQPETNNENIESTDQASSAKENQKSCRRIWLRSSNKISNKASPVKKSRVPLRRNKIKLKVSDNVKAKIANLESENKDSVKNPTRVSYRILNKVKLDKVSIQTPDQENTQQNVENKELIDFEEALSSSIVLKTQTTTAETENTSKQEPKCNSIEVEKEESGADLLEQHKKLNIIEDTEVTSQSNKKSDIRLEPTVVIEKLKSKQGDQLIIKSTSVKIPVKKPKVIVMKNQKRIVSRNKNIIKKCIVPKEATSNKIFIKAAPKNTASAEIGSSAPDNTNQFKPVVMIDQKVIKTSPIVSPLVRVKPNKVVDNNKSKSAVDNQKKNETIILNQPAVGDHNVTKHTMTASSQPMIQTSKVKPTDDVNVNDTTTSSLVLDLDKTDEKPTAEDDQKVIKQTTASDLTGIVDTINALKSTIVDNRDVDKQTTAVELPCELNESDKSKPSDDQKDIKQTGSTSESSATVQEKHRNDFPDCIKVSSELEGKNNQSQTLSATIASLDSEKTLQAPEPKPDTVMNKPNTIIQCNRSLILVNSENSTEANAECTKKYKQTLKPSLQMSDNVDINNVPVTQKNSEEVIDISETDDVQSTTKIQKSNTNVEIKDKDLQIHTGESPLCQENIVVLKDEAPKSDGGKKENVQEILNREHSKQDKHNDNLKRYEELKALAVDNAKGPSLTDVPNKGQQTYIKGDLKIEELPIVDSKEPNKKLVRISLPNGKVFRATIHGKMQGDFGSLFADPTMRSILGGRLNDGKRYTVNYRQVCKANKANPSKILGTQIQDLNIKEAQPSMPRFDTVNLISDDEDEVPTRCFTTEFGKYTTNVDEETFTMHQKKLNQKCEVKLCREDIFKSNKTRHKRNVSSGTNSSLTRNKSKRLFNTSAAVEVSTTTNIIPEVCSTDINKEIKTNEIGTQIPKFEQANNTPKVDTANIIEIDDSSNDSIQNAIPGTDNNINVEPVKKIVELKSLLLRDLGVGSVIDKNITFPQPKETAVVNLKSALLLDLGIVTTKGPVIDITADDEKEAEMSTDNQKQNQKCLENNPVDDITQHEENNVQISTDFQKQHNKRFEDNIVDDIIQNDEKDKMAKHQEQDNLKKCVVRLVNCDNLVKKYESVKTMKKCYVKVVRLNNLTLKKEIPSLNEKTNNEVPKEIKETNNEYSDEINQDNAEDFIDFDVDEPSGSPQLSRCPSLSILNNWDDDNLPLEIPYPTSPVMEIYDTIVQLRNKLKIELVRDPEKLLSLTCDSEWTVTKFGYRIQEILLRSSDIPTSENKIVPDCDNLVSGTKKFVITFDAPKLLTITLKFLEDNPDVMYRLESMRSLRKNFTPKKTSSKKLKRKTEELVNDNVASKILKLGTLTLNTLNSCIKILDVIRFSDKEENMTLRPDASSIENNNRVLIEPKDITMTIEKIEHDKQIDDLSTSDIETSQPEKSQTDLVAECDNNKECPSPTITVTHVNVETVLIADSNTRSGDDQAEQKCKEKQDSIGKPEENKTDLHAQYDNYKECASPNINVALTKKENNANAEEIVPIPDSVKSPTDEKIEEYLKKEPNESHSSHTETTIISQYAQCEIEKECSTPTISVPLVNEDTNYLYLEEIVQVVDTDMKPTDYKFEEKYNDKTNDSGYPVDEIVKEQSEPPYSEPDFVTEKCEKIKIDQNTNILLKTVKDHLSVEYSVPCLLGESSCDKNVTEDNHNAGSPSPLTNSTAAGDTESQISVEQAATEFSHIGNSNRLDVIPIDEIHNDVYEVEVVDTHIDDGLEIVETLHDKSQESITVTNVDSSDFNDQESVIKSPVFIDSQQIAFNYHDYTKQPKMKVDPTTSSINSSDECEIKNDNGLSNKECASETDDNTILKVDSKEYPSCEDSLTNHGKVNTTLKSNPDCKYELIQENDLLTVKITNEHNKDDNENKTVFVGPNDEEEEPVASFFSDETNGDIDIKGFEFEDIYVFPLNQSASSSNNSSNDCLGLESNSGCLNDTAQDDLHDIDFHVIHPEITYSRKRKMGMRDIRVPAKKYRKGKNIDCSKQTVISMTELAYAKEYKRLLEYCSSVKFSYTRPYHKECIEVDDLVSNWPINNVSCDVPGDVADEPLFVDLQEISSYQPDPMTQTFNEEINYEYDRTNATSENLSSEASEANFNMGFGERSGRVIQILKKGESNISAATLSDVKQSQPVFKSVDLDNSNDFTTNKDDQIKIIRQHVKFTQLRDKVRTFFKKSSVELKSDWIQNTKVADFESKCNHRFSPEEFPFDLCSLEYVKPFPTNNIVQVVQVGQLPVSAAAQNPVTCDPRVTQVSDASPSQCSVDNSPNDDSQSEIKTEYTELTTADLTLPLQEYAQQNQASLVCNDSNLELTEQTISLEMEIKAEESPEIKEEMPDIKEEKSNSSDTDLHTLTNSTPENMNYAFENNTAKSDANSAYDSSEQNCSEIFSQQRQQNGTAEKTDQIAHAMNAAGITTTPETVTNTRAQALVNILSQKIRHGSVNTTQTTTNAYSKTTSINAMALQQALAQILPPPLNQTGSSDNNQGQSTPVGPQVLHIVQGKNASGNQITLVDNSQQSVISTPNATQVLHIVQNKNATSGQASNGTLASQGNSFSGLSLVDAGLQQGGNQLLHIVNTGNQKNASPGQLLKRVNLLTNLTNVQGSNEQKMVQFVCKSADGKAIQLNAPHQRSMVLRLQPIETPNNPKPAESQEPSPSPTGSASSKESQQEIKSRSIYEENYAKFIQNSSSKTPGLEKSTSLPKFNQAFGKPVFQEGQKQGEAANNNSHLSVNTNTENAECPASDNTINLEHIGQISSPPLLLRKQPVVTSASQPNIVQQIKQTIAPMNIQTMHGGVIYTRQIPVNIGGGQTINLITVPSTELINDDSSKTQTNQGEIENSIIKIVPQNQTTTNTESSQEESNNHASGSNENAQTPQPQPVLTQMRIKLPMLSKAPQMVPGARVVRPSFFQIQRNVIGGANQPVYQQLVLTAAPPLGQQTIRLPQAQASRPVKTPSESQSSSSESQMSTSTLEQLREFDMVLEQVKERSTVQPGTNANNSSFKIHTTSSDTTDGNGSSNCSTESTPQVLYSIGNNQSLNVAYVSRKATVTTPTTSTYVRSPDSTGIADSPTSSTHVQIPHTVTTDSSPTEMSSQSKPAKVGSKSKSRPKSTSNPPNTLKLNSVPPKTSSQKPLEDEQTTQRILYILAEYKEQVENSPDKDKPAPRRRSNPPSNPGSSKRKKSSSSRRSGTRDMSPIHGEDTCRTMGSEDSSCGTSQGDCTESCLDSHSPQDSPRKVARKITFDQELTVTQPRPQPQRNVIVADGQTITVARGTTGKPATAVLMPANYILPVSMMKGGQQIAIVTNRGPKLLTVGGEGGATNALLLQRLIGPAGLKPVLTRPGVRHVRLPTAALHNLQAFNLATATTVQPPDSTASPTPGPTPPELVDTRATSSPWTDRDEVKPERGSSPEGSEPWNLPSSADAHEYTYEETVRTDNMDRTVLVVQKKDGTQRQHRLSHVSAAALRHKYAILEHELRLQKSLSEECEDLGVDSPSASELFPEAELLFAASPAHEHSHEHHSHTPQPHQSSIPQPDMDDQIATDHLIPREIESLGLGDVGIVAVSEDGSATIALDQEEFARSHPNTTFHSEPTEGEVQPFTITGLKGRHITSTIFHSTSAPATVLMTAPQATVISQAPDHSVKYEIENMINSMPSSHNNDINLSSVLVKDDGLTRFDNILTDSRELHLTNTASAIVHSSGNATQVIRRVCYEDDKRERDARYLIDEPDNLIAGDDAKMIAEDSSRDATLESMADADDDRSSPERHAELFWESNSASERSESRRPLDFSSDSDKCCKSPSFDETNSTDSSGVGAHMRLDSVIKEARGRERSGSRDGSSADDAPPLRTYPPKRLQPPEPSLSGKTRAGERSPDSLEVRRRASARGVVKRGCHCCNGEPAPPRPKKPRQRKPTLDFNATN